MSQKPKMAATLRPGTRGFRSPGGWRGAWGRGAGWVGCGTGAGGGAARRGGTRNGQRARRSEGAQQRARASGQPQPKQGAGRRCWPAALAATSKAIPSPIDAALTPLPTPVLTPRLDVVGNHLGPRLAKAHLRQDRGRGALLSCRGRQRREARSRQHLLRASQPGAACSHANLSRTEQLPCAAAVPALTDSREQILWIDCSSTCGPIGRRGQSSSVCGSGVPAPPAIPLRRAHQLHAGRRRRAGARRRSRLNTSRPQPPGSASPAAGQRQTSRLLATISLPNPAPLRPARQPLSGRPHSDGPAPPASPGL